MAQLFCGVAQRGSKDRPQYRGVVSQLGQAICHGPWRRRPQEAAADAERLARAERERQTLSVGIDPRIERPRWPVDRRRG